MNEQLNTRTTSDHMRREIEILEQLISRAEKGDANDQYQLGVGYDELFPINLRDPKEAVKWYSRAAKQGNSDAQASLGIMYEYGEGVRRDYRKAMECYLLAAEQGNIEAQFRVGELYMFGRGVKHKHNSTKKMRYHFEGENALKWLSLAANQGHLEAQETLRREYGFIVPSLPAGKTDEAK